MVTTDRADFAESLRRFRNHGISTDARRRHASGEWHYEMVLLGFNYRLTDVACALGLSQLNKLNDNLARRAEIAARYAAALRNIPGVLLPRVRDNVKPSWHLFPIRVDAATLNADRGRVLRALRSENIGVNVHYIPVHLQPYYRRRYGELALPGAESYYARCLSLPLFPGMADGDVGRVVEALAAALGRR